MKSNMPVHKSKTLFIIAGQILFFGFFVWYYVHYSFLRSRCDITVEYVLAIVLVLAMAMNYWLIYPEFYKKHSFWHYAAVTVVEVFLVTLLEYSMTIKVGLRYILQTVPQSELIYIKLSFFFNIMVRNLSLLGFVGLIANNFGQKYRLFEKDRLLMKKENKVIVRGNNEELLIDASSICYIQQKQNETLVFTDDGQQYRRRGSMVFFERTMASVSCVRISKNTIAFCPHIQSYTIKDVTIQLKKSGKNVTLPFGRYLASSAFMIIDQYMKQQIVENRRNASKDDAAPAIDPAFTDSKETKPIAPNNNPQQPSQLMDKGIKNPKYSATLGFISEHAGCSIKDIVDETAIPQSTVTRILAELKRDGLIEYVGSKKTGGYQVAGGLQEEATKS